MTDRGMAENEKKKIRHERRPPRIQCSKAADTEGNTMQKERAHKTKTKREPNLWRSLGYGVLTTLIGMAVCLLILSKIAYSSEDPASLMLPFGLGCRLTAGLLCGFLCGKFYGRNGAATGLLGGVALSLVLIVLSFCLPAGQSTSGILKWIALPVTVLLSVAGAAAACRPPKRRRRRA